MSTPLWLFFVWAAGAVNFVVLAWLIGEMCRWYRWIEAALWPIALPVGIVRKLWL